MSVPFFHVTAFSEEPFKGNPAAVVLLSEPAPDEWMQAVASEVNLPETAFVIAHGDVLELRWFSPLREDALCGHATIASAHVLWETGRVARGEPARFKTVSSQVSAEERDGLVWLDFPAEPMRKGPIPAGLEAALGVKVLSCHENRLDLFVELEDETTVRELTPDIRRLAGFEVRGVVVTAAGGASGADYVCRFFSPRYAPDEDPVTGSIQCALAPFWRDRLGRDQLRGYQCSPRGGWFQAEPWGDRVLIGGRAVTVISGELRPPSATVHGTAGEPPREPDVLLRQARADDAPAVTALLNAERLEVACVPEETLVAVESGRVVGTIRLKPPAMGHQELASLVVAPHLRRRGVATRLIREALARASGPVVGLTFIPGFFSRFGFRTLPEIPPVLQGKAAGGAGCECTGATAIIRRT